MKTSNCLTVTLAAALLISNTEEEISATLTPEQRERFQKSLEQHGQILRPK